MNFRYIEGCLIERLSFASLVTMVLTLYNCVSVLIKDHKHRTPSEDRAFFLIMQDVSDQDYTIVFELSVLKKIVAFSII